MAKQRLTTTRMEEIDKFAKQILTERKENNLTKQLKEKGGEKE